MHLPKRTPLKNKNTKINQHTTLFDHKLHFDIILRQQVLQVVLLVLYYYNTLSWNFVIEILLCKWYCQLLLRSLRTLKLKNIKGATLLHDPNTNKHYMNS